MEIKNIPGNNVVHYCKYRQLKLNVCQDFDVQLLQCSDWLLACCSRAAQVFRMVSKVLLGCFYCHCKLFAR